MVLFFKNGENNCDDKFFRKLSILIRKGLGIFSVTMYIVTNDYK
jgi:hypothetical protein